MYKIGAEVFISYRSSTINSARKLKKYLMENSYCKNAVLEEPETFASDKELRHWFRWVRRIKPSRSRDYGIIGQ